MIYLILITCLIWGIIAYFLYAIWKRTIYKLKKEIEDLNNLLIKRTEKIKEKNLIIKELKEAKCPNAIPTKKKGKN